MLTWRRYRGDVIDLRDLNEDEARFLQRCYEAWRQGIAWGPMLELTRGSDNPVLWATHGVITEAAWECPVFQALSDLEDRCGLRDGSLRNDTGADPAVDPLDDSWLPAVQAAEVRGVTLSGLHGAIKRGEIIARPAKEGGKRVVVSMNSVCGWRPNATRQRAGRVRAGSSRV